MASPTQRALAFCKEQGWTVQIVEKWNQWAKVRQDLFGCIDLVVLDGAGSGPLGVQVTSGSNVAARLTKARAELRLQDWLRSPARFEVWGYSKRKKRKKDGSIGKATEWVLRREVITIDAPQPHISTTLWEM